MPETDYRLCVSHPDETALPPEVSDRILTDDVLDQDGFDGLREGDDPALHALFGWDKMWEPDKDMIPLSKMHPDILFALWGHNQDDEYSFTTYYFGGRLQHEVAEIRIGRFDRSKLL